ncbi:MAG: sialidase family protein [Rhodospirillales bacterium]
MWYHKVIAIAASAIAGGFVCVAAAEEAPGTDLVSLAGTAATDAAEATEAAPQDTKDVPLVVKPRPREGASAIASSPTNRALVVAVTATETGNKCLAYRSANGGRTWLPSVVLPGSTNAGCYDADVAYAPDGGAVYAAYAIDADDGSKDVVVARSTDNGATWTDPPVVALDASVDGFYSPRLAVSLDKADAGWVYLLAARIPDYGPITSITVTRSGDRGTTWDPGKTVVTWDDISDGTATLTGGLGGEVLLVWSARNQYQNFYRLRTMVSRDHAGSFGRPVLVARDLPEGYWTFDAKIGQQGSAHIVYERPADGSHTAIGYTWSARPYTTWAAPVTLGDGTDYDKVYPVLAAQRCGMSTLLQVAWEEKRPSPDCGVHYTRKLARTGSDWSADLRVSDGASCTGYPVIAAAPSGALTAWTADSGVYSSRVLSGESCP